MPELPSKARAEADTSVPAKRLLEQVALPDDAPDEGPDESTWIDVIRKMDDIYAELVHYQVELEVKNAALEEAQQFIASVQTSMSDVLIVCDNLGRIEQVNSALGAITGRSLDELLGQPLQSVVSDKCRSLPLSFPADVASNEIRDCELSLRGTDGLEVPLAVNCSPRYDADRRVVGVVMIGRPIGELRRAYSELNKAHTELKQTQQQLIHSEKMASLGRLVAGVAHELNNPISFVYGNIHVLNRYCTRIRSYLDAVHEQASREELEKLRDELNIDHISEDMSSLIGGTMEGAQRVSEIVQELRRFSAIQRGDKEHCNLADIVRTGLQWARKGNKGNLDVDVKLSATIPVDGFPGQLQQVVLNLVQNAFDAVADVASPELRIYCDQSEKSVTVYFEDNGPGILEEHRLQLFDPFFTTKPVGEGTGLGLFISYGIVRDHGGDLTVEDGANGGTRFELSLPLSAARD